MTLSLLMLATIGVCLVAGGAIFAAFRKGGPVAGTIVAALVGTAAVGLCLMITWGVYLERHEDAHRAEAQARLRQIGATLHAEAYHRQEIERRRHLRDSSPIEAPRPGVPIEATIGDGERLVRSTPSEPLPEWAETRIVRDSDRTLVVVSGQQFADRATARQDALEQAADLVQWDLDAELGYAPRVDVPIDERSVSVATGPWGSRSQSDYPGRGRAIDYRSDRWTLDPNVVDSHAVRRSHTEEIRRTAGDNEFTVYRTHLLVELSPQVRDAIEPIWRQQVGRDRSVLVAGLLLLLTAIAGVFAGYFRLDDRTGGRYRWRLRFAALAATVLIGGTLFAGTRIATNAVRHRPVQTPSASVDLPVMPFDARTSPLETSVDNQDKERFREVADRMVKAINAEDYVGVRQDFNENMLERFPVEECREFFDEKISGKYGKINELEPPQFKSAAVAVFVARCERGTLNFTLVLDEHGQVAGVLFRPRPGLPVSERNQTKLVPGGTPAERLIEDSTFDCPK